MNPEFQRNLWLELTPRRITLMVALLALAFFASALSGGADYGPAATAKWLYYVIVVILGARNAALSVIGEIRDRTWDMQLLSSIEAGAMTWGKLFGSTAYNWLGGAICLAVMLAETGAHKGAATALIDLVYYVAIGVISQAAALLASLVAARRRQTHSRLDIFLYQSVGVAAGLAVLAIWSIADPAGSILTGKPANDFIPWWGVAFDTRGFLLISLALFTGWTLAAGYREMRLELKMSNGPLVWLAFLIFIGVYVSGFDAWLQNDQSMAGWDAAALRLGLAATAFGVLTYVMVVLEPKDRVQLRWLGGQIASGRLGRAWNGLQAWMSSYLATVLCSAALILWLHRIMPDESGQQALIAATLGFITRDVSIFVFLRALPGRRRGDLAPLVVLFALYALAPAIVNGLGLQNVLVAFYPRPTVPLWISPAVAWAEAAAAVCFAIARVSLARAHAPATA